MRFFMNTYDAIVTRRSTRKYKDIPVQHDKIEKIVEAGRYAPSGSNSQQNHFIVIEKAETIHTIIEMTETALAKIEVDENTYVSLRNAVTKARKGGYDFTYGAPVLIIVANNMNYSNNIADTACALENMMLEANELDLGSCWVNQLRWINKDDEINSYLTSLGMKETERVYGSMILGYADTDDGIPQRKALPRTGNLIIWINDDKHE